MGCGKDMGVLGLISLKLYKILKMSHQEVPGIFFRTLEASLTPFLGIYLDLGV